MEGCTDLYRINDGTLSGSVKLRDVLLDLGQVSVEASQ